MHFFLFCLFVFVFVLYQYWQSDGQADNWMVAIKIGPQNGESKIYHWVLVLLRWLIVNLKLYLIYRRNYHRWRTKRPQPESVAMAEKPNLMMGAIWNQRVAWIWLMTETDDLCHSILDKPEKKKMKRLIKLSPFYWLCSREIRAFSHPSGGKRAKNRLMRGDASDEALSSGDVLWLSSEYWKYKNSQINFKNQNKLTPRKEEWDESFF